MAYEIIGNIYRIDKTEAIATKDGGTLLRRSVTLYQKRFDQNTGEEFEPNFPALDFTNNKCQELDKYKQGDRVRIRFDISGIKYADRQTGEERFFNSLRGFKIEPYVQHKAQPAYQPPVQGYQPTPAPFPPQGIDPKTGLPF